MLDNKSFVSSANYLTDLNSMYSYDIYIKTNNLFVANSTLESRIRYFDRTDSLEKEIVLYIGTQLVDNINALTQIEAICKNIRDSIADSTVVNNSYINGINVVVDIKVTSEYTILKDLNIKAKYNTIVKYDLYSTSDNYIQILTNAGLIDIKLANKINDVACEVIPNIDEILLVDDKAAQVSADTLSVTEMKNEVTIMRDETIVNSNSSALSAASALASKNSALASLTSTLESEANANISEVNAKESELNSKNSENASKASELISVQKASEAIAKAAEAIASANNAHASELNALDSKNIAITKASEALQSASSASTSEDIATKKASEALTSANNADVSESNAKESELLAEKWASENENVIVAEGKYSSMHYALKSQYFSQISVSSIDDVNASNVHTYSSSKIETDLNVIGFDLAANVTVGPGQVAWNATEGTYDMGLENGSVLQAGQENIRKVTNNSGALISNGILVMYNGTNGASGRINVKPFTAGFNEAIKLYGVATQSIANGSDGIITIEGKVRGIDTTGASVGEVWVDNDILYAKPNDNGRMTKVVPSDNELKIVVASVIKSHHTNGTLEIRFMPFNENVYYTKVQSDILLNSKVPLGGDFTLDLGEL